MSLYPCGFYVWFFRHFVTCGCPIWLVFHSLLLLLAEHLDLFFCFIRLINVTTRAYFKCSFMFTPRILLLCRNPFDKPKAECRITWLTWPQTITLFWNSLFSFILSFVQKYIIYTCMNINFVLKQFYHFAIASMNIVAVYKQNPYEMRKLLLRILYMFIF